MILIATGACMELLNRRYSFLKPSLTNKLPRLINYSELFFPDDYGENRHESELILVILNERLQRKGFISGSPINRIN